MVINKLKKLTNEEREKILSEMNNSDFFFVEIGANDGKINDPIYDLVNKYKWKGILIEPLKDVFKKLKENYSDRSDLIFENCAIGQRDGSEYINRATYNLLSSFCNIEEKKVKDRSLVNVMTWKSLIKKHSIRKINLLHIDTEGMDCFIINEVLDKGILPDVIEFENNMLTNEIDSKKTYKRLEDNGYELFHLNYKYACYDIFAIRGNI